MCVFITANPASGIALPNLYADNFRLEELNASTLDDGRLLLRTLFLSLDPYMRGRLSDAPSYAPPVEVGQVIVGGTVSRVAVSNHPAYQEGDLVPGQSGWQSHAVSDGAGLTKLDPKMTQPSLALGALGMPGFTAYMGLLLQLDKIRGRGFVRSTLAGSGTTGH